MRYKLLGLAVILLISTPFEIFAQKMSPIIIKTGKPIPSVVRSGEPFQITYQATYTDAVLIIEEQMRFNSLTLTVEDEKNKLKPTPTEQETVSVEAEIIDLVIGEKIRDGSEETGFKNVQDFTYTFMIISEHKGSYKIPSFNFVWVKKGAGTTIAEAKDKEELKEFPTKEVGISYITSIVRPPTIDVRDSFNYDSFELLAGRMLKVTHGAIGLAFLAALFLLAKFYRQPKAQKADEHKNAAEDVVDGIADTAMPSHSLNKTRKKFFQELNALEKEFKSLGINWETWDLAAVKLYQIVRMLILAELSEGPVRVSDAQTPKEIFKYLSGLNNEQKKHLGRRHDRLLELSRRLRNYYESAESGSCLANPEKEISDLRDVVKNLNRRKRFFSGVENFLLRISLSVKNSILRRR